MNDADLVIVVPMLGRPHRVVPLLASIRAATPHARVVFAVAPNDHHVLATVNGAMTGDDHIELHLVDYNPVGDYARKINIGYRASTEPLIFTAADDLDFRVGWYQAACAHLRDGIGVVGTNDLGSPRVIAGEHSTHSLVTRDYADQYGTIDQPRAIYCEMYWHEYVDDEMIETAKHRNAFAPATDAIVEHLHPNWGKAAPDPLYAAQRSRMVRSVRIYQRRRHLWQG